MTEIAVLTPDAADPSYAGQWPGVLKRLADRHFILEKGTTVWTGTSEDLSRDHAKVQAWVGV